MKKFILYIVLVVGIISCTIFITSKFEENIGLNIVEKHSQEYSELATREEKLAYYNDYFINEDNYLVGHSEESVENASEEFLNAMEDDLKKYYDEVLMKQESVEALEALKKQISDEYIISDTDQEKYYQQIDDAIADLANVSTEEQASAEQEAIEQAAAEQEAAEQAEADQAEADQAESEQTVNPDVISEESTLANVAVENQ